MRVGKCLRELYRRCKESLGLKRCRRDSRHERIRSDGNNDWRKRKLREQSITGDGVRGVWRAGGGKAKRGAEGGTAWTIQVGKTSWRIWRACRMRWQRSLMIEHSECACYEWTRSRRAWEGIIREKFLLRKGLFVRTNSDNIKKLKGMGLRTWSGVDEERQGKELWGEVAQMSWGGGGESVRYGDTEVTSLGHHQY